MALPNPSGYERLPLEDPIYCVHCHKRVEPQAAVCPSCQKEQHPSHPPDKKPGVMTMETEPDKVPMSGFQAGLGGPFYVISAQNKEIEQDPKGFWAYMLAQLLRVFVR